MRAKACVLSVCREHDGAGRNNPGKGKRDGDCCGAKGNTGCDVGYVHSLMNDADWAKIGGRTAGFKTCNSLNQQGNTCCTKGLDVSLTMGLGGDTHTHDRHKTQTNVHAHTCTRINDTHTQTHTLSLCQSVYLSITHTYTHTCAHRGGPVSYQQRRLPRQTRMHEQGSTGYVWQLRGWLIQRWGKGLQTRFVRA